MRMIGRIENTGGIVNDLGGNRLNDLIAKVPGRVLHHKALDYIMGRTQKKRILPGKYNRGCAGAAATPHGLLRGYLPGEIQRFFQAPGRHKWNYVGGRNINYEFLSLELRF